MSTDLAWLARRSSDWMDGRWKASRETVISHLPLKSRLAWRRDWTAKSSFDRQCGGCRWVCAFVWPCAERVDDHSILDGVLAV